MRAKAGFESFPVDHVHGTLKQARDIRFQARIVEHCRDNLRVEVDQDVDVAIGALLVAGNETERGGMPDAMRLQLGFALLQGLDDLVAFRVAFYTTNSASSFGK
jgi:hypothetical protein